MNVWDTDEYKLKTKNEKPTPDQLEYLSNLVKNIDFKCTSKFDISNLISILSKFQNCYAPCGKHIEEDIGLFEINDLDWCLHNCNIDVHDCKFWNKHD